MVFFAIVRFKVYLVGRHFTLETNHLPILGLWHKTVDMLNVRLQQWIIQLQKYDFDLVHIKGRPNLLADALLRNSTGWHHCFRNARVHCMLFTGSHATL